MNTSVDTPERLATVITHTGARAGLADIPWLEIGFDVDASDWIALPDDDWRAAAGAARGTSSGRKTGRRRRGLARPHTLRRLLHTRRAVVPSMASWAGLRDRGISGRRHRVAKPAGIS